MVFSIHHSYIRCRRTRTLHQHTTPALTMSHFAVSALVDLNRVSERPDLAIGQVQKFLVLQNDVGGTVCNRVNIRSIFLGNV